MRTWMKKNLNAYWIHHTEKSNDMSFTDLRAITFYVYLQSLAIPYRIRKQARNADVHNP